MINIQEGTAIITRTMNADEIEGVMILAKYCKSVSNGKPGSWFIAHPTIVAEFDNQIVGFTSYTIAMVPGHGEVIYGMDMCVHPTYRGRGIARGLHMARLAIAKSVGCNVFMGVTKDIGMARILKSYGAHACIQTDRGTLYVGEIREF